uniref:7TM GPCR serpentine receptor class x (Srx) domain-containing protein n=1 Tax=Parascaris univalens TaxID=6257 RepID=A0A915AQG1_PARUN
LPISLGITIALISSCGLLTNGIVLVAFINKSIRFREFSMILLCALTIVNMTQLILYIGYLVPSVFISQFIFGDNVSSEMNRIIGLLQLWLWYFTLCTILTFAMLRVYMCFKEAENAPSTSHRSGCRFTIFGIIVMLIVTFIPAFISQFTVSCCTLYLDYRTYGQTYIGNEFNVSLSNIYFPSGLFVTMFTNICHIFVYIHNYKMRKIHGNECKDSFEKYSFTVIAVFTLLVTATWIAFSCLSKGSGVGEGKHLLAIVSVLQTSYAAIIPLASLLIKPIRKTLSAEMASANYAGHMSAGTTNRLSKIAPQGQLYCRRV